MLLLDSHVLQETANSEQLTSLAVVVVAAAAAAACLLLHAKSANTSKMHECIL